MRRLFIALILIAEMAGCMHVQKRPYCKNLIASVVLSSFLENGESESASLFTRIHGLEKLKYLDRMFADTDGITEASPYFNLGAKLLQKLLQGHADVFYACDDNVEVFLCIDYDADETLSRECEDKPGTTLWRWHLLYSYLYAKYDLHTHKQIEIDSRVVDGFRIEYYQMKVK